MPSLKAVGGAGFVFAKWILRAFWQAVEKRSSRLVRGLSRQDVAAGRMTGDIFA